MHSLRHVGIALALLVPSVHAQLLLEPLPASPFGTDRFYRRKRSRASSFTPAFL